MALVHPVPSGINEEGRPMTTKLAMATLIAATLLATGACRPDGATGPAHADDGAAHDDHQDEQAAHGPESGDWCAGHAVPESACTLCNPELIPAFQAKGDWCAEHQLPESVCPICRPQPGAAAASGTTHGDGSDEGPTDGTRVRLATAEAIRAAGIRTATAVAAPGERTLAAPARIAYDAARVALVNARSSGVVQRVIADVGTSVRRGAPLAAIQSAGLGADESRLLAARSSFEIAEANHARMQSLHEDGITPERDLWTARQELESARAELTATQAALRMVGTTTNGDGSYLLASPLGGIVTRRMASQGELVAAESTLFEVVDPSKMWAEVDIAEQDLALVRRGQRVTLHVDAAGGREFAGEIAYVAPEVDPRTRTARARVPLDNLDGLLRAHMFAEARIAVPRDGKTVLVPLEAVQRARTVEIVFVRLADELYEARRVVRGSCEGELVAVMGNVHPGDEVVTQGSFLLKTETLKDSIGAGCVDDH